MPTGYTLDQLKQTFQQAVNSELFGRRLAYLYALLFEPDMVRSYIDDDYLLGQVETDSLRSSAGLFRCVAMIETALDNQVFSGTPSNSIGNYLRKAFEKHDWPWPSHPLDWKRFFLTHHLDTLFLSL